MKDKQCRLGISHGAHDTLTRMTKIVNDGFMGGTVDKSQLASWILVNFERQMERSILAIRNDHFDEIEFLKAVLQKKVKSVRDGTTCPEFDAVSAKLKPSNPSVSSKKKKTDSVGVTDDEDVG